MIGDVFRAAIVEAEALLCEIAIQVERLDSNVCAFECPFQARPEVLDALSVDIAAHVFLDMVDRLMHEVRTRADCHSSDTCQCRR